MLILFIPNTGRCSIACVEITVRHFGSETGEREFTVETKTFKFSNNDILMRLQPTDRPIVQLTPSQPKCDAYWVRVVNAQITEPHSYPRVRIRDTPPLVMGPPPFAVEGGESPLQRVARKITAKGGGVP